VAISKYGKAYIATPFLLPLIEAVGRLLRSRVMSLNVVENVSGRARVAWSGASVLFLGLVVACAAVPSAGFWLALGDTRLASIAVATGFSIACCSFSLLISQQLQLPLDRLPARS
jgi:hypothetical protein